jgi:hypothetical protein
LRAYALEVSFERYSLLLSKRNLPALMMICVTCHSVWHFLCCIKKTSAICQSTASYNLPSAMLDLTALRAAALQTRRNASEKVYIEEQEDGELVESRDLSPDEQRNQTNIKGNLKHH